MNLIIVWLSNYLLKIDKIESGKYKIDWLWLKKIENQNN